MSAPATKENIQKTLGDKMPQFIASVASLVNQNQQLQTCDPKSVLSACLVAATLDLPINQSLGFAFVIPFRDKAGGTKAQFQMGYKGFVQLAQRSGQFKTINVREVKEGELKGEDFLTGEMEFEWAPRDARGGLETIGYVAHMVLTNGFSKTLYMTVRELTAHAGKYSQSYRANSSRMNLWRDDFDVMAKKTVLKLLLAKFGPMTATMKTAQLADQAVVTDDGFEYADNEPVQPKQVAAERERDRIADHIEKSTTIKQLEKVRDHLGDDDKLIEMYEGQAVLIHDATENEKN